MGVVRPSTIVGGLLLLGVVACATISSPPVAGEASSEAYAKSGSTKGVVILAVNWSRAWNCGGYENAEIMSLSFDRLPVKEQASGNPPDIFIDWPSRLTKSPVFLNYALLVAPGEYALTGLDIKAARSGRDIGRLVANRARLIENGKSKLGSFEVKAGETVYIGNFFLDCFQEPILWRYYTKGRDGFKSHMSEVKQKYPFIDPDKVIYRLFRTTTIGQEYQLPE